MRWGHPPHQFTSLADIAVAHGQKDTVVRRYLAILALKGTYMGDQTANGPPVPNDAMPKLSGTSPASSSQDLLSRLYALGRGAITGCEGPWS